MIAQSDAAAAKLPRSTIVGRLRDFWTKPIRPEPVALVRIVAGTALLIGSLMNVAPDLLTFWGPDRLIPNSVADGELAWAGRISLLRGLTNVPLAETLLSAETRRSIADFMSQPACVVALFVIWMIALVTLTIGFWTRTSAVVAWLSMMSFNHRGATVLNGGDDAGVELLFYLILMPSGVAWSVDALRRKLKAFRQPAAGFESPASREPIAPPLVAPWAIRLCQIQLCWIYLSTALSKMHCSWSNDWLTGEAVYWVLNDVTLTRWSFAVLPVPMWICRLLSWGTIVFEYGFVVGVWSRRCRPWLLIAGALFHVSIWASMEIGWFSQYMLCYYPIFLSGEAVARFGAWLARRAGRGVYHVYYDTFCPICRRSRYCLEQLDLGRRLAFRDIHDRDTMAADVPGVTYQRALQEMIVRSPSGQVHGGFDGFRAVAWALPALWPVLPLLYIPGVPIIARRVYRWIAKNRYRFAACENDVCSLHLKALSAANLDEAEITRVIARARKAATATTSDTNSI